MLRSSSFGAEALPSPGRVGQPALSRELNGKSSVRIFSFKAKSQAGVQAAVTDCSMAIASIEIGSQSGRMASGGLKNGSSSFRQRSFGASTVMEAYSDPQVGFPNAMGNARLGLSGESFWMKNTSAEQGKAAVNSPHGHCSTSIPSPEEGQLARCSNAADGQLGSIEDAPATADSKKRFPVLKGDAQIGCFSADDGMTSAETRRGYYLGKGNGPKEQSCGARGGFSEAEGEQDSAEVPKRSHVRSVRTRKTSSSQQPVEEQRQGPENNENNENNESNENNETVRKSMGYSESRRSATAGSDPALPRGEDHRSKGAGAVEGSARASDEHSKDPPKKPLNRANAVQHPPGPKGAKSPLKREEISLVGTGEDNKAQAGAGSMAVVDAEGIDTAVHQERMAEIQGFIARLQGRLATRGQKDSEHRFKRDAGTSPHGETRRPDLQKTERLAGLGRPGVVKNEYGGGHEGAQAAPQGVRSHERPRQERAQAVAEAWSEGAKAEVCNGRGKVNGVDPHDEMRECVRRLTERLQHKARPDNLKRASCVASSA